MERIVPELPEADKQLRVIIDTDAANEIDDLYAIALALVSPDRFKIEGFIATHYAEWAGPDSIEKSCELLSKTLEAAGAGGKYIIKRSAHPMQYPGYPSSGEAVDFIIERAYSGDKNNPLWVIGLGAATNLASAILKYPGIIPYVRYVFHARSSETWPERSKQFNVRGDILAARTLLSSKVPLVWFDTGTNICCSFEETEKFVASTGPLGEFIHNYRRTQPYWMTAEKGFYDLGDIAWIIRPELCKAEIVDAPYMDHYMFFEHNHTNGRMLRIYDIDAEGTWKLFFKRLAENSAGLE